MNKKEFMEGIYLIQDNYHKKLSKEQLELFYEQLKDMSKEKYIENIKKHISNNPFIPNIAQIKSEQRRQFSNYEQRDYSEIDFEQFYANKE